MWKAVMLILLSSGTAQVEFPSESACFDAKPTVERSLREQGRTPDVICVRIPIERPRQ